jgi:uncharacterized protein YfaP (DUF2135 family)
VDTINIGDVKKRVEIAGTIRSMRWYELDYPMGGRTDLHIIGEDGTHAYWRCSRRLEDEGYAEGDKITVRATIEGYERLDGELVVRIRNGHVLDSALALF